MEQNTKNYPDATTIANDRFIKDGPYLSHSMPINNATNTSRHKAAL
jgi:hypothetical protein